MSLRYWIRGQDQELFEVTDRMDFGFTATEQLEEGSSSVQNFLIRDPLGDLELWGHRIFAVEETEAEDPDDRFVFIGYIGVTTIRRGPYTTGAARVWDIEVADLNTVLTRRVMVGTDNDRPDETDVARVEWVEGTHEGELIDDTRYLSSANPVNMDDNDYLLQPALNVYSDASQQSGKNFGLTYFGDVGVDVQNPWGFFSLWYDFASSDAYQSTARLTNLLADIDGTTTFPMSPDDELRIDWMRVFSTIIVPYKGSYVVASSDATRTSTARRDQVMNAPNVNNRTTASARANRYIRDLDTPEYRATITTIVPRAKVNAIRPGMAVQVKATHWASVTGSEYVWMRVLSRRVTEIAEEDEQTYAETFELSWSTPVTTSSSHARLYHPHVGGDSGGLVRFGGDGDDPPPGKVSDPTTGLVETLTSAVKWNWYGIQSNGTGSLDFRCEASMAGARRRNREYVITMSLIKHTGDPYALETSYIATIGTTTVDVPSDGDGGYSKWTDRIAMTCTDPSATPGDCYSLYIGCAPNMAFFTVPAGVGSGWEGVEVNGSLV